jgi:hypothetical protein
MLDQIPDPASMESFLKNLFQKGKFSTMFLKVRFVIVEMFFFQHQPELIDARILEVCPFADPLLQAA